jgi:hypothetical protein
MTVVLLGDLTTVRVLVTRASARELGPALAAAMAESDRTVIDFAGVEGVTPSFIDEVLLLTEKGARAAGRDLVLDIRNPPTRLSEKFSAIGRGHGLLIEELESGTWHISPGEPNSVDWSQPTT